jgi:Carboxypeptidase regulatory-like domain
LPPTQVDGSASISNLGHGNYLLSAAASGYGGGSQLVSLTSGAMPTIEIRLESLAATVEGQVTDGTSEAPLAGATVTLAHRTTVTDSAGHYRLEGVPPGAHTLQVSLEGYGAHHLHATIEPRGNHTLDATLSPLPGLLKVRVVDAATGRPIESATVSYTSVDEAAGQGEQPCADYALLVPLKRSRQYRAVRSRVSDLRPSDAWQQDDLHFFVFALNRVEGDAPPPVEAPVAVFAMRPDVAEPVSAVVVRPRAESQEAEITPLGEAESASAPQTS